jgi:hypothetical protein
MAAVSFRPQDEAIVNTHRAVNRKRIRLDKFEPYQHYAIGKMDIERAEPLAFEGSKERLRQTNPPVRLLALALALAGYSTLYGRFKRRGCPTARRSRLRVRRVQY